MFRILYFIIMRLRIGFGSHHIFTMDSTKMKIILRQREKRERKSKSKIELFERCSVKFKRLIWNKRTTNWINTWLYQSAFSIFRALRIWISGRAIVEGMNHEQQENCILLSKQKFMTLPNRCERINGWIKNVSGKKKNRNILINGACFQLNENNYYYIQAANFSIN